MDAGVASLLGALVGASASLAATAYAERARQKRDERARKSAESERTAVAARLVQDELRWAEKRLLVARRNRKYWSRRYALEDDLWQQYREPIALALATSQWNEVAFAFMQLKTIELQAGRNRSESRISRPDLDDWGKERIDGGLKAILRGIEILEPLTAATENSATPRRRRWLSWLFAPTSALKDADAD